MQKFKKGDKIRIIKYGHISWTTREGFKEMSLGTNRLGRSIEHMLMFGKEMTQEEINKIEASEIQNILSEKDGLIAYDLSPNLVGKEGVIVGSYADLSELNAWGTPRSESTEKEYEIEGIPEKAAWWSENQLELIE